MKSPLLFSASLARKISLLFGVAVLLTIVVTLFFPWLQMSALDEQAMLFHAQQVASTAYMAVDLQVPNWELARRQLARQWPDLAKDLDLPEKKPLLLHVNDTSGAGFQRDAVARLQASSDQRYYWRVQRGGDEFRFAMAVRHRLPDKHPGTLRGIIDVRLPVSHVSAQWNSIVTVLAGASGAMLAILAFYMVTQRLVLNPLQALRGTAERVTSGDMAVRSNIQSNDEFEDLSNALNEMLKTLNEARIEQERINRSLDVRLGELAETNVGLYESNRLKNEFLANVSHELRTPLVSIIGFAELLRDSMTDERVDANRRARFVNNILTSGRSLLDLINDLLDLAKIEAGRIELHMTEFSVAELCEDMMDFVRPLADKREQKLELSVSDDIPHVRNDVGKIKQILYNLLSNAIKFSPREGRVALQADTNGDGAIRFSVVDSGPGIPESERDHIFEKFTQLDASKSREYEGTGLGLAITRELVNVLNGKIELFNHGHGGSTFVVEIPADCSRREDRVEEVKAG